MTKNATILPTKKTRHLDKGEFLYYWAKQIKNLSVMSGRKVNDVADWLYRDYLTRESDEVHASIHAFVDKFVAN